MHLRQTVFHSLLQCGNYVLQLCSGKKLSSIIVTLPVPVIACVFMCRVSVRAEFFFFFFSDAFWNFSFTVAPTIQSSPQTTVVHINASAVLECIAEGVPTPRITWRKDGVVFTGNNTRYYAIVRINILLTFFIRCCFSTMY